MPWRLPAHWLIAVFILVVALGLTALRLVAWVEARSLFRAEEKAAQHARAGELHQALVLAEELPSAARRRVRALVLDALESDLRARAERDETGALERGDELLAEHGERWPELLRRIDPLLRELGMRREARGLCASLLESASQPGVELAAFEEEWARTAAELRRLGRDASDVAARCLTRAWATAALQAAERRVADRRFDEARALLAREIDVGFPMPPPQSRAVSQSEAEPPSPGADEALEGLEAAVAARDLGSLRELVRVRPGPGWRGSQQERFEHSWPLACRALASLATERAREADDPSERLDLLRSAATCDEILPRAFLGALTPLLAELRVQALGPDGPWPMPEAVGCGSSDPGAPGRLSRLACSARLGGEAELARRALLCLEDDEELLNGLTCPEPAEALPRLDEIWPRLDYPSPTTEPGEERP